MKQRPRHIRWTSRVIALGAGIAAVLATAAFADGVAAPANAVTAAPSRPAFLTAALKATGKQDRVIEHAYAPEDGAATFDFSAPNFAHHATRRLRVSPWRYSGKMGKKISTVQYGQLSYYRTGASCWLKFGGNKADRNSSWARAQIRKMIVDAAGYPFGNSNSPYWADSAKITSHNSKAIKWTWLHHIRGTGKIVLNQSGAVSEVELLKPNGGLLFRALYTYPGQLKIRPRPSTICHAW